MTYFQFAAPRPVTEWIDSETGVLPGNEVGGRALPPHVLDSHSRSVCEGLPDEYVAIGEDRRPDGATFLRFAVTREYIEATTSFRQTDRGLVYVCPDCEGTSGKHSKRCGQA